MNHGAPFRHRLRPRYAECDRQGVVFNAHYLTYFDVAITELWRTAFGGYDEMLARGVDLVVAEAGLRFRAAAHFDEELELEVAILPPGTTSLPSRHRILRGAEVLVEATLRHVTVELTTMAKTPVPEWMRDGLAPWTVADEPDATPPPQAPSGPARTPSDDGTTARSGGRLRP